MTMLIYQQNQIDNNIDKNNNNDNNDTIIASLTKMIHDNNKTMIIIKITTDENQSKIMQTILLSIIVYLRHRISSLASAQLTSPSHR